MTDKHKTPEQLAETWVEKYCADWARRDRPTPEEIFLAGYEAARPKWISVKERLPELLRVVPGVSKVFGQIICHRSDELDDDGNHIWNMHTGLTGHRGGGYSPLEYEEEYPTHWCELPEPPKDL